MEIIGPYDGPLPDNLMEDMPDDTYCKCGGTSVFKSKATVHPAFTKYNMRILCPACGEWTDAVPGSE